MVFPPQVATALYTRPRSWGIVRDAANHGRTAPLTEIVENEASPGRRTYSIVIPLFNEEETLPELGRRVQATLDELDGSSEVILIDDGSGDRTFEECLRLASCDQRFKTIRLSRNFGHEYAITAGTDAARGDAVIVMDGDLQDPPELIPQLVERWRAGFEVVYAVRQVREGESWLKRKTASLFYAILKKTSPVEMPAAAGDFRLVDRKALAAFLSMREQARYVRGMIAWVGFRQAAVPYVRPARFAGRTKYTIPKMLKLAVDAVLSFSELPLLAVLRLGLVVAIGSLFYGIANVALKLLGAGFVHGWASVIAIVTFVSGVQLVVLAAIGTYVARTFQEVKRRPLYVVREAYGFDDSQRERITPFAQFRRGEQVDATDGLAWPPDLHDENRLHRHGVQES
jgi:polyisoprenyl-phosphate glycosyltransferase